MKFVFWLQRVCRFAEQEAKYGNTTEFVAAADVEIIFLESWNECGPKLRHSQNTERKATRWIVNCEFNFAFRNSFIFLSRLTISCR